MPKSPVVIDLRRTEDTRDAVHRAVQTLTEGKLVVFPTETVYGVGAAARSSLGVERLFEAKRRSPSSPFTLAVKSAEEALDYAPQAGTIAERLARRCWPGPVTIVVEDGHPGSLVHRLPPSVRQAVAPNNSVGFRVPAHPIVLDVLKMLSGPIALTSANLSGSAETRTAEQALRELEDEVALVLDDGPCRYGQASTVVRVTEKEFVCLREGVVGLNALKRLANMIIVLVCTGNTCRSPMGEVLLKKLIAEKLQCVPEELDQKGVLVASAGVAALPGCAASEEAVEVMHEMGLDISKHESQPLSEKLVRHADLIYTMTGGHREAILRRWPEASPRIQCLSDEGDIADPIGGPKELYRQCAEQVEQALRKRIETVDFS